MMGHLLTLVRELKFNYYSIILVSWTKIVQFVWIYGLLTKCDVVMAGYWPTSSFECL